MVAQTVPEDRPLTAEEFLLLPMVENRLYELHQGERSLPPAPDTVVPDVSFTIDEIFG